MIKTIWQVEVYVFYEKIERESKENIAVLIRGNILSYVTITENYKQKCWILNELEVLRLDQQQRFLWDGGNWGKKNLFYLYDTVTTSLVL